MTLKVFSRGSKLVTFSERLGPSNYRTLILSRRGQIDVHPSPLAETLAGYLEKVYGSPICDSRRLKCNILGAKVSAPVSIAEVREEMKKCGA